MINGLEGIPGSGKSYEACVFHVLHALKSGRKVITNLPLNLEAFSAINPDWLDLLEIRTKPMPVLGTWDAQRVPAFQLFTEEEKAVPRMVLYTTGGSVQIRKPPKLFGHVWDFYSEWKAEDGSGPLFIVDECHVSMPKIGTDLEVIEWFSLHRHFNCDVLLATQQFRKMDPDIAGNMAMMIRVRNADILGLKGSYIRKVHAGFRGAVISEETRKLEPQFFCLYKSHTQGNSVAESLASDVTPELVKFNRFKWAAIALTVPFVVYAFWPSPDKPKKPELKPIWLDAAAAEHQANPPRGPDFRLPALPPSSGAAAPAVPASGASVSVEETEPDLEPFKAQGLHLTGWLRSPGKADVFTFAVSSSGQLLFNVTLAEITKSGYKFEPLGECAGLLRFAKKVRTVICDAPVTASGRNNYPVVLAGAARSPAVP